MERESEDTTKGLPLFALSVIMFIVVMWLATLFGGLYAQLQPSPLFADAINGVNALFTGCAFGGVIITLWLQSRQIRDNTKDLKKALEANLRMARHAEDQAIYDMFQTYCSEYFQGVKDSSMSVLIACVKSREYCAFVASRLMVAGQLSMPHTAWEQIQKGSHYKDYDNFLKEEQRNRYKLDELINFFTLLVGRRNSEEIIGRCDFSYSWWRPLLWLIAIQQQKHYDSNQALKKYNAKPRLIATLRELDKVYGLHFKEEVLEAEFWNFFLHHPKVLGYGLDPAYARS